MKFITHLRPVTGLITAAALLGAPALLASSHSDAPLIKQDPQANLTDVYAFIGTRYDSPGQKVLNVIVSVRPFSEPGDGVIYERFADDAVYSIHIADPVTGASLTRYDFQFSSVNPQAGPGLKNTGTILSYGLGTAAGPITTIGDAQQNFTQTYSVKKNNSSVGTGLKVPPPNVGKRTTPAYNDPTTGKAISGATDFAGLDSLTRQGVQVLGSGEAVWAGPREDGFFADTPGIFDLLDPRILGTDGTLGQGGDGVDGFQGFNVLSFGLQIPVSDLPSIAYTSPFFGAASGVGVYAAVSRPRITIRSTGGKAINSGPLVQVNRLANPLFNEVLVALKDKDGYNRTSPAADATKHKTYAENPEVAALLNFVYGTSFVTTGRADLAAVYIPDVIRVDTRTDPVKLPGQAGFHRLGFIGGDTTTGAANSGGWPNGRRPGDDTVDIALTAVASGPTYSSITLVGDNIHANDQLYNQVFPYLGTPHAGPTVTQRSAP
ncbi:MAG: DUF4331 domain-containing protein [Limisphaerales bacterium]